MEKRLEQVFFEVRELNLRVTVVETRQEERVQNWAAIPFHSPQIASEPTAKKRGRPKKSFEE